MGKAKNLIMTQVLKHMENRLPDPYIWVFSSVDNCHYNYNSRYLFEYVRDNLKQVKPLFVINDDKLREQLGQEYGEQYFIETNTVSGIRKVLNAGVWFTSAGLPVYGTNLRKNRLIINLWHGVPLKHIALLDPNMNWFTRLYFRYIFSKNYTGILTTSKALVPVMADSFAVPRERVKVWGQPRNDRVFNKSNREEILSGIYQELPTFEKAVLYAPTWRDYGDTRLFPFEDFDREKLENFLEKNNMVIFIRTHISEKGTAEIYLGERVRYLGVAEAEDITGILNIFDLLITDYSSIYIDYLLIDKPIIFLPYDKEIYLKGRGMNFEYDHVTPGPKPDTMEDFLVQLGNLAGGKDDWQEERSRVNGLLNEIKEPCSGKICARVLQKIQSAANENRGN